MVSIQRKRPLLPERVEEKCTHLVKPGFVDIHTHGLSEYTAAHHIETTMHAYTCNNIFLHAGGASDVPDYWTNPGKQ